MKMNICDGRLRLCQACIQCPLCRGAGDCREDAARGQCVRVGEWRGCARRWGSPSRKRCASRSTDAVRQGRCLSAGRSRPVSRAPEGRRRDGPRPHTLALRLRRHVMRHGHGVSAPAGAVPCCLPAPGTLERPHAACCRAATLSSRGHAPWPAPVRLLQAPPSWVCISHDGRKRNRMRSLLPASPRRPASSKTRSRIGVRVRIRIRIRISPAHARLTVGSTCRRLSKLRLGQTVPAQRKNVAVPRPCAAQRRPVPCSAAPSACEQPCAALSALSLSAQCE